MALRTSSSLATACVVAALAAPAAAQAGSVEVTTIMVDVGRGTSMPVHGVVFAAGPGEANRITATSDRGSVTIADYGAPLKAGPRCTQVTEHEARCGSADAIPTSATVLAGDGDDTIATVLTRVSPRLHGGDGDDRIDSDDDINAQLVGGAGADILTASGPESTLIGGAGPDRLTGGPGFDSIDGDGHGALPYDDAIDGGGGAGDTVLYSSRTSPIAVDLAAGRGGAPDESDSITGAERVGGGSGDDVLTGDGGPNELLGNAGADRIAGGGGDDRLQGGSGVDWLTGDNGDDQIEGGTSADRMHGGGGDDVLDVGGDSYDVRQSNEVRCGTGADTVLDPSRYSGVPRDCEVVSLALAADVRFRRRNGRVLVGVSAPRGQPRSCRAGVWVGYGDKRVGYAAVDRVPVRNKWTPLRLTPYGARLLRRRAKIELRVIVSGTASKCRRGRLRTEGRFPAEI